MDTPTGPISAITLFQEDLAASKEFYLRVFALPVHWEDDVSCVFLFGTQMINLLQASEADELITPRPVATVDSGARIQFTIEVPDVDAAAADLATKGVEVLNGPQNRAWGIRTVAFADPSGHVWEYAGPVRD